MFTHQMQDGWGLTTDGKVIFGSDGTSTLYWLDPKSLKGLANVQHWSFQIVLSLDHSYSLFAHIEMTI